jgi:hypothetical protein
MGPVDHDKINLFGKARKHLPELVLSQILLPGAEKTFTRSALLSVAVKKWSFKTGSE